MHNLHVVTYMLASPHCSEVYRDWTLTRTARLYYWCFVEPTHRLLPFDCHDGYIKVISRHDGSDRSVHSGGLRKSHLYNT